MAVAVVVARPDERRRLQKRPRQDRPELSLETPVVLRGWKREIDISERALTRSMEMEIHGYQGYRGY